MPADKGERKSGRKKKRFTLGAGAQKVIQKLRIFAFHYSQ